MDAELEKLVEAGKLPSKAAEKLDMLKPGTFCLHKSWGFGRVAEWNLLLNQVVIDFTGKKGHPMQLQYAAGIRVRFSRAQGRRSRGDQKTGQRRSGCAGSKHFGKPRWKRDRPTDQRLDGPGHLQ